MPISKDTSYVYVGIIVPISIFIPILLATLKYKSLPAELKIISWYLYLSGAVNIITSALAFHKINNMPVLHIYTVMEFLILSFFYKKILIETNLARYINFLIIVFLTLSVLNVIFFQNLLTYNSYTKSIESIFIIFFTIYCFNYLLDRAGKIATTKNMTVYINSGVLIYFSGSFLVFIIYNVIISNYKVAYFIWDLHATFLLTMYTLFTVALWKYKK